MGLLSGFVNRIFPTSSPKSSQSLAKSRLKLVLASDRSDLDSKTVESIRREMIEVVAKYVDLDIGSAVLDIDIDQTMTVLTANLPFKSTRDPDRRSNNPEAFERFQKKLEIAVVGSDVVLEVQAENLALATGSVTEVAPWAYEADQTTTSQAASEISFDREDLETVSSKSHATHDSVTMSKTDLATFMQQQVLLAMTAKDEEMQRLRKLNENRQTVLCAYRNLPGGESGHEAAIKVQSSHRRTMAQSLFADQRRASLSMQSFFKGSQMLKFLRPKKARVAVLQQATRRHKALRNFKTAVQRVIPMQACARGFSTRVNCSKHYRAAIELQRVVKGKTERVRLQAVLRAVGLIQSYVCGFFVRTKHANGKRLQNFLSYPKPQKHNQQLAINHQEAVLTMALSQQHQLLQQQHNTLAKLQEADRQASQEREAANKNLEEELKRAQQSVVVEEAKRCLINSKVELQERLDRVTGKHASCLVRNGIAFEAGETGYHSLNCADWTQLHHALNKRGLPDRGSTQDLRIRLVKHRTFESTQDLWAVGTATHHALYSVSGSPARNSELVWQD